MKFVIALLCLAATSFGQTYRTVTANTNDVIRTNFTIPVAQVSGAMATNGSAAGLTNFPPSLLRTNGDGSGLTNLPNANLTNATGILPISNGGTGATNAALAISNLLPAYSTNTNAVLALNSNATSLVWTTNTGGGGLPETPLSITNGGTGGTNFTSAAIGLGIVLDYVDSQNGGGVMLAWGSSATNAGSRNVVIGYQASATNTNSLGVAIGRDAIIRDIYGIAIGTQADAASSVTIGSAAFSDGQGIAIGAASYAYSATEDVFSNPGGIAIGYSSDTWTNGNASGVAIGNHSYTDADGVALGLYSYVESGFSAGENSSSEGQGIAIGHNAFSDDGTDTNGGIAIGFNATSQNLGHAIGEYAYADGAGGIALGNSAEANLNVQIGTGTNSTTDTIQFLNAGSVTTNQWTAIANSTALGHGNMAAIVATNSPTNTNAPSPDAWMLITEGTNNYYLPLWQ